MAPRLYLIGRPVFDRHHHAFLDDFLPADDRLWKVNNTATPAERLVEFAGRVCYMSFGSRQSAKTNAEYIANLIGKGHESVLEHAVWTIAVSGMSRAFTHQLVRHRVGFSVSQLSQQYHDETEARFIRPAGIDQHPDAAAVWDKAIRGSQTAYRKLLKELVTSTALPSGSPQEHMRALRSAARSVLPNATETALVVTANARSVRYFLKVRGNIKGDVEMRCFAAALLELIRPEGPSLFSDFYVEHLEDGLPVVVHRPTA